MAELVPRKIDEGTTTCLVGDDVEAMRVAEEVDKKTKKVRGANTLRRKKNKTKKELPEGEAHGVEPKKVEEESAKNEGEVKTKSEEGAEESDSVSSREPTAAQPTPAISPRPPTESGDHQGGGDEAKSESEGTAEKKTKVKKKGKKKAKKGGDDTPSSSLHVGAAVNSPSSPRTAEAAASGVGQEEKKKKKKKKKPKTPRGAGAGGAVVTPLKIEESEKNEAKNEKNEGTQKPVTNPPLSAVRAGPAVRLTSSSSSVVTLNAPPSPSLGVKFAQRLSLANVIPKLSSLPFEKKPRTFNSNIYNQSFSGKTLVKWMLEAGTGVKMDLEAMILGELMLNAGVIVPLSRKVEFSASGKDFYALTEGYVDFARPRVSSVGGSMIGGGSTIGRTGSEDIRRASRRSSVMLTFRSLSVRGINHVLASKDKEKKDDETGGGGGDQNLVYGKSLEEVMALQKESHPDEKVPIILKTLTKAIIDTNGHKTEGIFRVPGKNDEIFRLKAQFNKTDYSITSDDPNDLGGCLKMWFRELKDPLIPNNIYDDCVLVANNPAECLEMVSTRVPELNKTVIYFLLGFLQEMTRHAGVTRMGSANLGMVFAPGLLRCEDVMKMMTNTAHEGAFVKNLIENYRPAEN